MKLRDKLKSNDRLYRFFNANLEKVGPFYEKTTPFEYTFHGIKHCNQLEEYLDYLIPDKLFNEISAEEIFILLNGVYYHDIGMIGHKNVPIFDEIDDPGIKESLRKAISKDDKLKDRLNFLEVDRNYHNVISSSMIYYGGTEYNNCIIDVPIYNYAKSIAALCEGHRNYKENGSEVDTLAKISELERYDGKVIHTRFLASILRIADELDVTERRAPFQVFIELKNFLNEQSLKEWNDHRFISMVEIDGNNSKIIFHLDEETIKERDKQNGDNIQIIRNIIFTKREKVERELEGIRRYIYDSSAEPYRLGYEKIIINYNDIVSKKDFEEYRNALYKVIEMQANITNLEPLNALDIPKDKTPYITKKDNVLEFNRIIDELHEDNLIISTGSFVLRYGLYSRFYINTNIIIPRKDVLNLITDIFYEKYYKDEFDCVIGVDNAGHILAPNLSLKLKCNYTYLVIKESDKSVSISFEKDCSILKAKRILIVTDVISTGGTIKKAIKEVNEKFHPDILKVGCVFSVNDDIINEINDSDNSIYYINNRFQFKIYSQEEIDEDITLKNEFNIIKTINK